MRGSTGPVAFVLSSTAAPSVWLAGQGPIGLRNLGRVFGIGLVVSSKHTLP
jgi:hypothetical protein